MFDWWVYLVCCGVVSVASFVARTFVVGSGLLHNLAVRVRGFDCVREVSCYYDYGFGVEGARVVD
jgi:hypothetical protein